MNILQKPPQVLVSRYLMVNYLRNQTKEDLAKAFQNLREQKYPGEFMVEMTFLEEDETETTEMVLNWEWLFFKATEKQLETFCQQCLEIKPPKEQKEEMQQIADDTRQPEPAMEAKIIGLDGKPLSSDQ